MAARRFRRDRQQWGRRKRLALGTGAALGATALAAPAAQAVDYTVANTSDSGSGSLRAAIADANDNPGVDNILFQSTVTGQINLESELLITEGVNVQGPGAGVLNVSGQGDVRVLVIEQSLGGRGALDSNDVSISGLTISNGFLYDNDGAGITNVDFDLTVTNSVVRDNEIATPAEDSNRFGAGIASISGSLTVQNSTVSNNYIEYCPDTDLRLVICPGDTETRGPAPEDPTGFGGGIGIIENGGDFRIVNSTISGNSAGHGGGISVYSDDGQVDIENSTIADNLADQAGGGIYRKYGSGDTGDVNLLSTIVGDNSAPDDPDLGEPGSTEISQYNAAFSLIEVEDSSPPRAAVNETGPNIIGQAPALGALGANGGPTETHVPAANSPALDKGIANGLTTDQRGFARTADDSSIANAVGGDGTDIGSVELSAGGTPGPETRPAPLTVRQCMGEPATIVGTTGKDVLVGTEGRDVIRGLRGNDTIKSLGGDDVVCGDKGTDKIRTGEGDDKARGGNSGDRMRGGEGDDVLRGGSGLDNIRGEDGDDQLFGGAPRGKPAAGLGGGGPGNVCDGGGGTDTADGCETVNGVP